MLKEYIEAHKEEIVTIPMENITLTEKIHNHGKSTPTNKSSEDLIIAVRQIEQNKYSLVVGWAEYMEARNRGMENIKCVVTTDNRYNFVRKNLKTYHIGKIKIPGRSMTPPAKFWSVPCKAMPTAREAAPRIATKEVIGIPM